MTNKILTEKEIADLIEAGFECREKIEAIQDNHKSNIKVMDNMSNLSLLTSQTDKLLDSKSKLALRQARRYYDAYLRKVETKVNVKDYLKSEKNFETDLGNSRITRHFLTDLSIRLDNLSMKTMMDNIDRVITILLTKQRSLENAKKRQEEAKKFDQLIEKIEAL